MQRKRFVVEIDGRKYSMRVMGADQAAEVLFRIGGAIGAPLEALLRAAGPDTDLADIFRDQHSMALGVHVMSLLVKNLGSQELLVIRDMLLDNLCEGDQAVADISDHFAGQVMAMFQLMWKALQHNFDDFLSALRSMFGQSNAVEPAPAT